VRKSCRVETNGRDLHTCSTLRPIRRRLGSVGVLTEKTGAQGDIVLRRRSTGKPFAPSCSMPWDRRKSRGGKATKHPLPAVSGKPIEEPVAWHGPLVMNTTRVEAGAYSELRGRTFYQSTCDRLHISPDGVIAHGTGQVLTQSPSTQACGEGV